MARLGCDGSVGLFPGLHPELIGEGPPEQVEVIVCQHAFFEAFKHLLNRQVLIVSVDCPVLLYIHSDAVHDPKHAEIQTDRVHDFITIDASFEFTQLPGGSDDLNGMHEVGEGGVVPAGTMTTSGD